MPPPYGLTLTGFNRPTAEELLSEVETELRADISPLIDVRGLNSLAHTTRIVLAQVASAWEALESVYQQFDPLNAEGEALDSVSAITGTLRLPARRTIVQATCLLEPGMQANAGQMIAWLAGDATRRFRNSFAVAVPGSGGAGINVIVQFEAENPGPVLCPATYLTLFTPGSVPGWIGINNLNDGVVGSNVESDSDLRLRRERELAKAGAGTQPAVLAAILSLGVETCTVLFNDTDTINLVTGLLPHSIECIVVGGNAADIGRAILYSKGAGDGTNGNTAVMVPAPNENYVYQILYTVPTDVLIYLVIRIQVDSDYPGETALKDLITTWGNRNFRPGDDVVSSRIAGKCFEIPGIWNVLNVYIGNAPAPVFEGVFGIQLRQRARFLQTRITVMVI